MLGVLLYYLFPFGWHHASLCSWTSPYLSFIQCICACFAVFTNGSYVARRRGYWWASYFSRLHPHKSNSCVTIQIWPLNYRKWLRVWWANYKNGSVNLLSSLQASCSWQRLAYILYASLMLDGFTTLFSHFTSPIDLWVDISFPLLRRSILVFVLVVISLLFFLSLTPAIHNHHRHSIISLFTCLYDPERLSYI